MAVGKTRTIRITPETARRLEAMRRPGESMRAVVERLLVTAERRRADDEGREIPAPDPEEPVRIQ